MQKTNISLKLKVTSHRLPQQSEGIQCHQTVARTVSFHQAAIFLHAVTSVNTTSYAKTRTIKKVRQQQIPEKAQQIPEIQGKGQVSQLSQ